MKIKYFQNTDTLHIELRAADLPETKDLDEDTLLDNICGIVIGAATRINIP